MPRIAPETRREAAPKHAGEEGQSNSRGCTRREEIDVGRSSRMAAVKRHHLIDGCTVVIRLVRSQHEQVLMESTIDVLGSTLHVSRAEDASP